MFQRRHAFAYMMVAAFAAASLATCGQAADQTPAKPKTSPPENVSLKTSDGVDISTTYYPSSLGKDAVPVILLHAYKGSRADMQDLATVLQAAGHAVIVPDLRGHGQSTRQLLPSGQERQLNVAQLNRKDIEAMAYAGPQGGGDVETCKAFLVTKNNAGQLNIDKLCIVGAEMGATVAANWAAGDWPQLPRVRQGRDVKALALISPTWAFKGVPISAVLNNRNLAPNWSWLIAVGEQDAPSLKEAKQVNQALDRFFPTVPDSEAAEKRALFFLKKPTSLQGTKLLATKNLNLVNDIKDFIDLRLVKKSIPWSDRSLAP